jgi:tetratricopeptide (TPR) repeat protein
MTIKIIFPFFLLISQQTVAQSTTSPSGDAKEAEILVKGRPDPDEPDHANWQRKVIVGSRIPRVSLQHNPNIASATSLGGLTPDSGLDAWQSSTTKRWKTCKADGAVISKRLACALLPVQKAMEMSRFNEAEKNLLLLSGDGGLTTEERYVVNSYLYKIAERNSDLVAKSRYLAAMVDTGMMPGVEERAAVGTLASWSLKADDFQGAISWYRILASADANDTQSRINAAILLSRVGKLEESKGLFREAIEAAARGGKAVPDEWRTRAR